MAEADKLLEERANRAKEILNKRYKSLRQDQVRDEKSLCPALRVVLANGNGAAAAAAAISACYNGGWLFRTSNLRDHFVFVTLINHC
jgi:hypothetical protein